MGVNVCINDSNPSIEVKMRFSKFPKILVLLILVPVYIIVTYMFSHHERKSLQKGKLGIKSKTRSKIY